MKFTKKLLGFAVVLTLLVLLLTLGASAEIKSGNCGVEGNESSVTVNTVEIPSAPAEGENLPTEE